MANTYVNKVQLADGTTLIDISSDTVTAAKVLNGYTAHKADGSQITGSIQNGTVTNNTSGGSSSGTINRGNQIKIGAGYYSADQYYQAQANSGTLVISYDGTTSVDGYANVTVNNRPILRINVTSTSSTTKTISSSSITEYHYPVNEPQIAAADITWTTSSGQLTLSCASGIPAMTLYLAETM